MAKAGDTSRTEAGVVIVSEETTKNWPSGIRPWFALLGCFFLMANSWGIVNAYGTFQSYYDQHLLSQSNILELNLVGASQCFWILVLSAFQGRLLDAGYSRILLVSGTILSALGFFLLSIASPGRGLGPGSGSWGAVYATQGTILSLGMSFFFVASSYIAATWFPQRKSIVVSIVACGASISGFFYPFAVKELLNRIGFNNAVRVAAGIALLLNIFACLFAVPNTDQPIGKPDRWFAKQTWIDAHAWGNSAYIWFVLAIALMFAGFYPVFFNLEEWAASKGFGYRDVVPGAVSAVSAPEPVRQDAIRVFYLLSFMNASSSAGRLAGGWFAQRHGVLLAHACVITIAAVLLLLWWPFVNSVATAKAFVVVFGAFSGAVIGLPPASVMSIMQEDSSADRSKIAQWIGMMYTCSAVPALIGPVIAGAIVQRHGFIGLAIYSGSCFAASAFCMMSSAVCARHGSVATAVAKCRADSCTWSTRLVPWSRKVSSARKPSASPSQDSELSRESGSSMSEMT